MRDSYYQMYQKIIFNKCFYREHQFQSTQINYAYSVSLVCLSTFCAIIWAVSEKFPLLWASVIAIAQLAQALSDWLPWKKRLAPLKFLCPKLDKLALEVELYWLDIDLKEIPDGKIKNAINKFSTELEDLCCTFADSDLFPEKHESHLWKTATKKAILHFENRTQERSMEYVRR